MNVLVLFGEFFKDTSRTDFMNVQSLMNNSMCITSTSVQILCIFIKSLFYSSESGQINAQCCHQQWMWLVILLFPSPSRLFVVLKGFYGFQFLVHTPQRELRNAVLVWCKRTAAQPCLIRWSSWSDNAVTRNMRRRTYGFQAQKAVQPILFTFWFTATCCRRLIRYEMKL